MVLKHSVLRLLLVRLSFGHAGKSVLCTLVCVVGLASFVHLLKSWATARLLLLNMRFLEAFELLTTSHNVLVFELEVL